MVLMEHQVRQVWTGQAVRRALMERQAVAGLQVRTALMGLLVPVVRQVQVDQRDLTEHQGHLVFQVLTVTMDHLALQGPVELQVKTARQEPLEPAEVQDHPGQTDLRGLQGLPAVAEPLENRGRQGHQEVQEPRAVVDLQEKKAKRGRVVLQAPPAPQVKVAHRALPDHRVTRAVQERVDLPAPLEPQARMVRMERQGPPVLQALPAAQGHPVQRGMRGVVARQEAQERLRLPEPQVRQEVVVLRVKPEPLALPERQVARGPPRLQAVRGQVEVQAPQLRRVLRGRADRLARQEHRQPLHPLFPILLTALHGME